jgi:secreted trypsin-like serine protease
MIATEKELVMRRPLAAFTLALLALVLIAAPAGAITGGRPDNGEHPQVGMIIALFEDGSFGFCSGTLIAPTVVLTAGHCTAFFDEPGVEQVLVSFDETVTSDSTFFTAHAWFTHPDYVDADWPFTQDVGVVILDEAVDLPVASLPEAGLLETIISRRGESQQVFVDVGYGQTGVETGGGPPRPNFPLERRQSSQHYAPGRNGMVGVMHGLTETLVMLKASPSARHGSGCGGDSGGPIFLAGTTTLAAIHIGGYRLGFDGALCGRLSSLNFRLDTPVVLDWLAQFV